MKETLKKTLKIIAIVVSGIPLVYIIVNAVVFLIAAHQLGKSTKEQRERFDAYVEENKAEYISCADLIDGYIYAVSEETDVPADDLLLKITTQHGNLKTDVTALKKSDKKELTISDEILKSLNDEENICFNKYSEIQAEPGDVRFYLPNGNIFCRRTDETTWECSGWATVHGWE